MTLPSSDAALRGIIIGFAAAAFFRKDFQVRRHGQALVLSLVAGFVAASVPSWVSLMVLLLLSVAGGWEFREGTKKNMLMVLFVAAFVSSDLGFQGTAMATAVAAVSNLIRNPESLKLALRPIRVAGGPVYVIGTWLAFRECPRTTAMPQLLLFVSAVAATVASTVLRPDNTEVSRLLAALFNIPLPPSSKRRLTHGLLMLFSVLTGACGAAAAGCHAASLLLFFMAFLEIGRRCCAVKPREYLYRWSCLLFSVELC